MATPGYARPPYSPTRFPAGITNANDVETLGDMGQPDPTKFHTFFNDFDTFVAADWTVTETQAGATQALADGDGGLLLLTNSAADNDVNAIQLAFETFVVDTTKRLFFKCRLKVNDAINSSIIVGLVDIMTSFNPANGIYLFKDDGATPMRLSLEKAGVTTNSLSATAVTDVANDTFFDLGFAFDPRKQRVTGWINNNIFSSIIDLTNLPVVALSPAVGLRNGEAVAKTMTVDYIFAAKER